jgi:Icc-related predicted phosphoesterase
VYPGAIRTPSGVPWTPDDAMEAHARDRSRLFEALAADRDGPVVVVTHHPPIVQIVDAYRDVNGVPWWVPAFYGSTVLDDLPAPLRPDLWISGHFHASHDVTCGPTRCVANPMAAADFDPDRVVAPREPALNPRTPRSCAR